MAVFLTALQCIFVQPYQDTIMECQVRFGAVGKCSFYRCTLIFGFVHLFPENFSLLGRHQVTKLGRAPVSCSFVIVNEWAPLMGITSLLSVGLHNLRRRAASGGVMALAVCGFN